jgi:hypothetical protein
MHLCCGPCALTPVRSLQDQGCDVVGLFLNPNIHPAEEYIRRRDSALAAAEELGIKVIVRDQEYEPQAWFREIAFRETNRCFHCYRMRLERTAQIAARGNFDAFTTSLLYSKFQKHDVLKGLCQDLAAGSGPEFLYQDFREGWTRGIEQSKAMGLYRQDYCGCLYSEVEHRQKELRASPQG